MKLTLARDYGLVGFSTCGIGKEYYGFDGGGGKYASFPTYDVDVVPILVCVG